MDVTTGPGLIRTGSSRDGGIASTGPALDCSGGTTCPTGMLCYDTLICAWS